MLYPSVNIKHCILSHAIRNNLTYTTENVLTIKACVKEQFLFNVYSVSISHIIRSSLSQFGFGFEARGQVDSH